MVKHSLSYNFDGTIFIMGFVDIVTRSPLPIVLSYVFSRLVLKCQQLDGYIIFHQIVK